MPRYSTTLLDLARDPVNAGPLANATVSGYADLNGRAPRMTLHLRLGNEVVIAAGFETFGCGVSVACGAMLTKLVQTQSLDTCAALTADQLVAALDGVPPDKRFCADLALRALQDALTKARSS